MSTIWIKAELALKIVSNVAHQTSGAFTLCERAYAELIRGLGINNVQEPASHELKELMAAVAKLHGISMNNL
jgi:hypothetical protein